MLMHTVILCEVRAKSSAAKSPLLRLRNRIFPIVVKAFGKPSKATGTHGQWREILSRMFQKRIAGCLE
jgi:hypothetical protein